MRVSSRWAGLLLCGCVVVVHAQVPRPVQPGAPGESPKELSAVAAAVPLKPPTEADVRFMQDMIMHHGQAVEMTELAKTRAQDPEVKAMAAKIDLSQGDEIRWMKQWLGERGVPLETSMDHGSMVGMDHGDMAGMDHTSMDHGSMAGMDHAAMDHSGMAGMDHHADHGAMQAAGMQPVDGSQKSAMQHKPDKVTDPMDVAMMPGMLTPRQMQTLRGAHGNEFDRLFLTGMMQHHGGALLMVRQLFEQKGAGEDPQLFDFANDVDNTQLAEIDIMNGILRKVNP